MMSTAFGGRLSGKRQEETGNSYSGKQREFLEMAVFWDVALCRLVDIELH
jgi:hypothetical protein